MRHHERERRVQPDRLLEHQTEVMELTNVGLFHQAVPSDNLVELLLHFL